MWGCEEGDCFVRMMDEWIDVHGFGQKMDGLIKMNAPQLVRIHG